MESWVVAAACRGTWHEMVPDEEGIDGRIEVLLAKKICSTCPVTKKCLAEAERLRAEFDNNTPHGVWGGLTGTERDTMHGLDMTPRPCARCGLACIPVSYATDRCAACDPDTQRDMNDYWPRVTRLVDDGLTYAAIAGLCRLPQRLITDTCRARKTPTKTPGKPGKRAVKPCGTLAAKERHRKHKESWMDCACRHVAWRRGNAKKK